MPIFNTYYDGSGGGGGGAAGNVYLTTGIIDGLELQAAQGTAEFTITQGSYQVIDLTDIANITFDEFTIGPADFVNVPVPDILTTDFTYVFLDGAGALFTKDTPPVIDDVTNLAYIGNLTHVGSPTITDPPTNLGWHAYNTTLFETKRNFVEGSKRYFGLEFDFAGNGVSPDISAGETFRLGSNRLVNPAVPDRIAIPASVYGANVGNFTTLSVRGDGGGGIIIAAEAGVDFLNFDDGTGVLAPVGNNRYANHYFYLFPTPVGGYVLFRQYGQVSYATLNEAVIGQDSEAHFPFLSEAAVIGTISGRNNVIAIDVSIAAGDAFYTPAASVSELFR